jgi:hypothetical protein
MIAFVSRLERSMEHPGLDFHGETDLSQCKRPSLSSYTRPDGGVKRVNIKPGLLSETGLGCVV